MYADALLLLFELAVLRSRVQQRLPHEGPLPQLSVLLRMDLPVPGRDVGLSGVLRDADLRRVLAGIHPSARSAGAVVDGMLVEYLPFAVAAFAAGFAQLCSP